VPGQPEPVYPPGQFSLWNRPSVRAAWLGISRIGDSQGDSDAEPGYAALAVSDPSADLTATQTWAAIEDDPRGDWPVSGANRDWRSHAEDTAPADRRRAAATAAQQAADAARESMSGRRGARGALARGDAVRGNAVRGNTVRGNTAPGGQTGADVPGGQFGAGESGGQRTIAEPGGQPEGDVPAGIAAATEAGQEAPAGRRAQARSEAASPTRARPGTSRRRGDRGATRTGRRPTKRSNMMMAALLLSPVLVVVLVVVGYVYISGKHSPASPHAAPPPSHPAAPASPSPTPTLGPWKHIEDRTLDALPLGLKELFPSRFTTGLGGVKTIGKSGDKCTRAVIGKALQTAVHKAHCTQVLRASYLSGNKKLMATIGVLNLVNVRAAERVGGASGAREFIKQLAAKHGPTRRLSKGTGLEEADVLGHYLILTWTEYTNLHKPSGRKQLSELKKFSADLITGTANVSLSSRMVTGKPRIP
jgi:hypothetical protein